MKKSGRKSLNVHDRRDEGAPNPFSRAWTNYKTGAKLLRHDLGLGRHPRAGVPDSEELRRVRKKAGLSDPKARGRK